MLHPNSVLKAGWNQRPAVGIGNRQENFGMSDAPFAFVSRCIYDMILKGDLWEIVPAVCRVN